MSHLQHAVPCKDQNGHENNWYVCVISQYDWWAGMPLTLHVSIFIYVQADKIIYDNNNHKAKLKLHIVKT